MRLKLNYTKYLLIIYLLIIISEGRAQQEPIYTQYNFNTQMINPAYAGTWDKVGFVVLGRNQWLGMEGSPQTYTFSMQASSKNNKMGFGLDIMNDVIGKERRLSLAGDYSYGLKISHKTTLSLGLKFGVTSYKNNLSEYIQYPGEQDPLAQSDSEVNYLPNYGVGAYLWSDSYFIGVSAPKLIENSLDSYENYSIQAEIRHFYVMGGYAFNLSDYLIFKPTVLSRASVGLTPEFDFSANFLLGKKVWLGSMYRTSNTFGLVAQWIFDNKLRIGYAVDFAATKLQRFNSGGHEVMVSYELGSDRKRWSTPRMF